MKIAESLIYYLGEGGMTVKEDIQFLKELQQQLRHEEECDNDCQASPRFWVIMDYKKEPANEEFHNGHTVYYHSNGDYTDFKSLADLKVFLEDGWTEDDAELADLLSDESIDFDGVWEYLEDNYGSEGFGTSYEHEVEFIVPDTMFLTKKEAKRHLELNHHHYTSKAHTYAMTAWRAPQVERLLKVLHEFDFNKIVERGGIDVTEKKKLPIERINDVAHLVPTLVLRDVEKRLMDWKASGGKDDDPYMEQQAIYVERWAKVENERVR